jgi:hypothetical protein
LRRGLACILLALAWLCPAAGAQAAERGPTPAHALFAEASRAFEAGEYATALDGFLAARAAGLSGPAVHYNIGVCAWRLGRLDEAERAFLVVAETPSMAALAHYNLGLVSLRRGDEDAARGWFIRARDGSDDGALRQLAEAGLARLDSPPRRTTPSAPRPSYYLSARAGYDDNVALVSDGELLGVSGTESAYAEGQFAAHLPIRDDLQAEASAYLLNYAELGEYDQAGGRLGLRLDYPLGEWRAQAAIQVEHNRLDGSAFENRRGGTLTAAKTLGTGWELRLRYRLEDVDGRAPFESLSGTRQQAALRLRRHAASHLLRLEYQFETNDRDSDAVSPDRHALAAEWTARLPRRLHATLGLDWRRSRFALAADNDYDEHRWMVSAGLGGELAGDWQWALGYDWSRNRSDAAGFSYRRNRLYAGVQRLF